MDARSDIYSVGVVLYEILTGRLPFEAAGGYGQMLAHQSAAPTPPRAIDPSIDPRLNAVVLRALAKDPANRFQSALQFQQAVAEAMTAAPPVSAAPVSAPGPLWRRAALVGPLAAGLCGALCASGYLALTHRPVAELPFVAKRAAPGPPEALLPHSPGIVAEAAVPALDEADPSPLQSARKPSNVSPRLPVHARSNALTFYPPAVVMPVAPERPPAPSGASQAELPPPPEVSAEPLPSEPPSLPPQLAEEVKPAAVKRHNSVVRALGKFFGVKEKPAGNP